MKKKLCFILSLILVLVSLTGCGGNSADMPGTIDERTQENKIIYAMGSEPEVLDPTTNIYSQSSIVLQNLFRGLYKIDQNDKPVPAIAKDHTVDETGTLYTFNIKEDAKWSNGDPLTAHDFEYSWKRVLDPEVASGAAFYLYYIKNAEAYNEGKDGITSDDVGVKALDDYTLEVTLENPTTYFLDLTCVTAYYPVKKDIVEGNDKWTKSAETFISNGPFSFEELRPKEKYVFKKNEHYVDADEVKLDTLEIVFIESPEAELAAYTNGEIDVSDNVTNEAMEKYQDTAEFFSEPRIGTYYLNINCEEEPFTNPQVRKAFSMAIDREKIIHNIVQAVYEPAFGFVPYGIPHGVETDKQYRDVIGPLFEENIQEAKKLLADAGYPNGEGLPTVKLITMASQSNRDVAQALQSMWIENLGADVEIQTFENKVYWDEIDLGNYHIARNGWTGDYPDPMTLLELFEGDTSTGIRWTGPEKDEYDKLLAENKIINDQEKRMSNYDKAESILMDEMAIIPIYFMEDEFLCKPHVKGVMKSYIGHTIFEYAFVE